jgi:hypothetical protein
MANLQNLTQLARRSPDPRLPSDYLRKIVDWRARGRGNEPFDYLFFYDHPVHDTPWFIAFNSISIDINNDVRSEQDWFGKTHHFRGLTRITIQLRVLNETDDLIPPSMQYLGDWIRSPKFRGMNCALVYNFRAGHCEEMELLQVYPIADAISASANFDYDYSSMRMRGRAESMRPLFDITFMCGGVGNYTTRPITSPGDFNSPATRLGEQRKLPASDDNIIDGVVE